MTQTKEAIKREELIQSLGIKYSATFVPFSVSRNKDNTHPSLNWKITLKKGNISLVTDYMQGIGHAPGYSQNTKYDYHKTQYYKHVAEHGKYATMFKKFESGSIDYLAMLLSTANIKHKLPIPSLEDILYSLTLDSNVLNYSSFEDWAGDIGYNADSRKDHKVYKSCMKTALELRAILGQDNIDKLNILFQDF